MPWPAGPEAGSLMAQTVSPRAAVSPRTPAHRRRWPRLALGLALVAAGTLLVRHFGIPERLGPAWIADNVGTLRGFFAGFGWLSPVVFIAIWVPAAVFFVPGLPLTIIGAVVFGAAWGTVYTSIGATLGATAAFLVGRYSARGTVENLVAGKPVLRRIDEGVRRHGWQMLLLTRLVPVFPFNAQNYVYGLTPMPPGTYVLVSWLAMIPGTLACNLLADSVLAGDLGRAARRVLAAGVLLLVLALLSSRLARRYAGAGSTSSR